MKSLGRYIPKLLGEPDDNDTQAVAILKANQQILFLIGCVLAIGIAAFLAFGLQKPIKGTWRYGVCKVFLERYVPFPTHLTILNAGEKQNGARIDYLMTNTFGSRQSSEMECFYNINNGQVKMSRVTVDRRPVLQKDVDDFNIVIPMLISSEDLGTTMPPDRADDIENLRF